MFAFQDRLGRVDVAFTDRHGGISGGPYASLNLSAATGDDQDAVAENLERVARGFGGNEQPGPDDDSTAAPALVLMSQVHGADVHVVEADTFDAPPARVDALVTAVPDLALVVRVADCVPLLLADVDRGVVGAAHAGRPGLVAGIVPNTVQAMRSLGARQVVGWIGPHVCGRCYEVPDRMRADVSAVVPEAHAETSWGTPAVDVGAGVRAQLEGLDVRVLDAARCTIEDEDLYSYRRQGRESGRMAGLVRLRS